MIFNCVCKKCGEICSDEKGACVEINFRDSAIFYVCQKCEHINKIDLKVEVTKFPKAVRADKMFRVKNESDQDVKLTELRVTLAPGEIIDLEKVASPEDIHMSNRLKWAVHEKKVKILSTKNEETKSTPIKKVKSSSNVQTEDHDIKKLHKAIEDLRKDLLSKINENNKSTAQPESKPELNLDMGDISDEIAAKIHAKSVQRIGEGVSSEIKQEPVKHKDDSLASNIEELDKLGK